MTCDICQKTFTKKDSLRCHLRRSHKKPPPEDKLQSDLYKSFIAENFDMTCDLCDVVFMSFYDARNHYKESHNENNGYIKCCKMKLKAVSIVKSHIDFHSDPDMFM